MPSSNGLRERTRTTLEIELRPDLDAPGEARRALSRIDGIDDQTLEDARLLVSELVANSVRHGELRPNDRIRLQVGRHHDGIRIEVIDPGPGFTPSNRRPSPLRGSGWGLYLVERIASEWGVSSDGETKVWCAIPSQ